MSNHTKHLISTVFVAAVVAGCASSPSRFYTLNSTAKAVGTPDANYAVAVGPVSIPADVDRPQITLQVQPNRVKIEEFDRWAAPLNENIARVVAADLSALLGTPKVIGVPLANFDPTYRVTIDVQRFESTRDEATKSAMAKVEAVWVVRRSAGGEARSGRTVASESAQGEGFDALADAHSRALAKLSGDIAVAIRAQADEKP